LSNINSICWPWADWVAKFNPWTALVLNELAVICRPGAASRRFEAPAVEHRLRQYRSIESIKAPGTLDGGDVLVMGKRIYVGLSSRTNEAGIMQLSRIVKRHGYKLRVLEIARCLHLKSAVSAVAEDMLLINPDWIDTGEFSGFDLLATDSAESAAANALAIGFGLIYPSSFPLTADKLKDRGVNVLPIDVSELQKAEGAVTCCSLVFEP
jgi:dimethylargininase